MEGKVAVLGGDDFVMPFSALGLDTFVVSQETEKIVESAKQIIDGNYTLIVVAEDVAVKAQEVFATKQNIPIPCVVVVPFTKEAEGFATKALYEILKMATGIDILQNN